MAPHGSHNLALRSDAYRLTVAVDLIARRIMHYRKEHGSKWKAWAKAELDKLAQRYQQPVRDRLNCLCGVKAK